MTDEPNHIVEAILFGLIIVALIVVTSSSAQRLAAIEARLISLESVPTPVPTPTHHPRVK